MFTPSVKLMSITWQKRENQFCLICVIMVNVISLDSRRSALITVVLGLPVPIDFALHLPFQHLKHVCMLDLLNTSFYVREQVNRDQEPKNHCMLTACKWKEAS